MFAHTCSRNYRCMRMNMSTRAINAAAVPFSQQVLVKFGQEGKLVWWVNCIARPLTIRQSTFFCLFLFFPSLQIPYWSKGFWNFIKSLFIAFFFISFLQWQLLLLSLCGGTPCGGSHQMGVQINSPGRVWATHYSRVDLRARGGSGGSALSHLWGVSRLQASWSHPSWGISFRRLMRAYA